jgi:hypothetical protein
MTAARALAALGAVAGLAACAALEPTPQAPAPTSVATSTSKSSATELVAYIGRIRTMTDGALVAEAARQKREANDLARVKAALALSLTQAEESEILALVEPVARRENIDAEVRIMASFLQVLAMERRRLKENAAGARRAQETQKQRAEALQQKLDALTELEKSLSDRQVPTR